MESNKQNLFLQFQSPASNKQQSPMQEEIQDNKVVKRKQRRSSTLHNLRNMNKNAHLPPLNFFQSKNYDITFVSSVPLLFKKSFSTTEIYQGKVATQDEIIQMAYSYLLSILANEQILQSHIKMLQFQELERNTVWIIDEETSLLNLSHKQQCSLRLKQKQKSITGQDIVIQQDQYESQKEMIPNCLNKAVSIEYIDYSSLKGKNFIQSPQINDAINQQQNKSQHSSSQNQKQKLSNISEAESQQYAQISETSFGFQYADHNLSSKGKNLLKQVSIYLSRQPSILRSKSNPGQVSLQIFKSLRQSFKQSSWGSISSEQKVNIIQLGEKMNVQFSKDFLKRLFFQPQPFLITITLIYLLKFLHYNKHACNSYSLTQKTIPLLLSTSLLIAYKFYQDQRILGLVKFFSEDMLEMKISKDDFVKVQKQFLSTIKYQAVISNQEFYKMLGIVKEVTQKEKKKKPQSYNSA